MKTSEEIAKEIDRKIRSFNNMRDENWGKNVEFDIAIKSQIRALVDLLFWINSKDKNEK